MNFGTPYLDDVYLTDGVLSRRCVAWALDVILVGLLVSMLWLVLMMFGLLTFGLGFGALSILPLVPFCYHVISLMGAASATPGQQMVGLTVRRDFDFGPPTMLQVIVGVAVLYLTLATSGLLLVVALFTTRHRTVHDLLSGLVVLRTRALTATGGGWNIDGGASAP